MQFEPAPPPPALINAWQCAARAATAGRLDEAIAVLQELLAGFPHFQPALVQLSAWQLAKGRYRDARALAIRACEFHGSIPDGTTLELLRLLRLFQALPRIEELLSRLDWSAVDQAEFLAQFATEAGSLGFYEQAAGMLDAADACGVGSPQVEQARAVLLMTAGDWQGAQTSFERVSSLGPYQEAQALWALSMRSTAPSEAEAQAALLRAKLQVPQASPEVETLLSFALHNADHAAGRWSDAWGALQRGCSVRLRQVPYERHRHLGLIDGLRNLARLDPPHEAPESGLIFVVGMHRSGTTLLERMLAGHDAIVDGGETYVVSAALREAGDHYCPGVLDAELVRRAAAMDLGVVAARLAEYSRWRRAGRPRLTEKLPTNFLNLGFVLAALPDARVLHMRRDPVATCFSNLRTCFAPGVAPYSYDQLDMAEYYLRYSELMRHWHDQWPGRILDVDYQALIDGPAEEARRVLEFCGLEFKPEVIDVGRSGGNVATASLAGARAGIRRDRDAVWRQYEVQLQPMVRALQGSMVER